MSLLRPTDARAAWSVTAGGKNSARSGDPAGMPPDRQAVVALPQARHADDVAPEIVGALEAQGLHPAEQISLWLGSPSTSRKRRWQCDQVTAVVRVAGPRSSQRWRRFADRRRGKASLRRRDDAVAKFFPVRRLRNLFLLSAHAHKSNYACARGREGNEAFIVSDYRGEYWR